MRASGSVALVYGKSHIATKRVTEIKIEGLGNVIQHWIDELAMLHASHGWYDMTVPESMTVQVEIEDNNT